jgi:SAM-dependent methyltransferase
MSTAEPVAYQYEGSELEVFQHAHNWKAYYRSHLRRYIRGDVLEVGGGIGATARCLCEPGQSSWTSLEPDPALVAQMRASFDSQPLPVPTTIVEGTLADMPPEQRFDAILYIDVLEHIESDREELARAVTFLRPSGSLIVLAPAHQWLYTPFDRAIGHYRRYSARSLRAVGPEGVRRERLFYLDSVGLLASLANKLLLKSASPTLKQIRFWDSVLVRMSRILDPLLCRSVGKTVIGVWRSPALPAEQEHHHEQGKHEGNTAGR